MFVCVSGTLSGAFSEVLWNSHKLSPSHNYDINKEGKKRYKKGIISAAPGHAQKCGKKENGDSLMIIIRKRERG